MNPDETMRIAVQKLADDGLEVGHVFWFGNFVALGEYLVVGDASHAKDVVDDVLAVVFLREGQIDDEADVDVGGGEGIEHVRRSEERTVRLRDCDCRAKRHFEGWRVGNERGQIWS